MVASAKLEAAIRRGKRQGSSQTARPNLNQEFDLGPRELRPATAVSATRAVLNVTQLKGSKFGYLSIQTSSRRLALKMLSTMMVNPLT
jgi:hypothetical protein